MILVCLVAVPIAHAQMFARIGALTLNSNEYALQAAAIDSANGFAYFGTHTAPGTIVKIRLSDFARVGAYILNPGENHLSSALIDSATGFAYFGARSGCIVKIRLSDFSRVGTLVMDPQENLGSAYVGETAVLDSANDFAYFSAEFHSPMNNFDFIAKVRLSDLSRVATLPLPWTGVWAAVIDTSGGFAYFGTYSGPARIMKVRLSDFIVVATLVLDENDGAITSGVMDSAAGFAYFVTIVNGGQAGKVVKIRLLDFARVEVLTLNRGEGALRGGAVIDPTAGFLYVPGTTYVGTYEPSVIVKVSLSDFSRVDALTLGMGETNISSGVIDSPNGFAYFATSTQPGTIVKIHVSEGTHWISSTESTAVSTESLSRATYTQTLISNTAMLTEQAVASPPILSAMVMAAVALAGGISAAAVVSVLRKRSMQRSIRAIDERVYDYIVTRGGEISLSRASEDLGLSIDELRKSTERLKKTGRLLPT